MTGKFTTRHTPESLAKALSPYFTCNIPWLERDLTRVSYNTGQFRLMESPLFFLIKNCCLLDPAGNPFLFNRVYDCGETEMLYPPMAERKEWNGLSPYQPESDEKEMEKFERSDLIARQDSCYLHQQNSLDKKLLRKVLKEHLGAAIEDQDVWRHFATRKLDSKNCWRFGLFAALVLHGNLDKQKDAWTIFDAMNRSMGGSDIMQPQNIDIGPASLMDVRDFNLCWREFNGAAKRHGAFENVFFMFLLERARRRGVISTSAFGWVKAFDRPLWYALSQTGRNVACAEACGAFSHYFAEEAMQKAIGTPVVELAVEGLEREMINEGWLPEHSAEYQS